jgi:heat shock protein HspQ
MTVERHPLYAPGQLVRHRRYGYRGVVADFDMTCMAEETWYYANQTRPPRNQPWYHVLVDGSPATTYAAQTSLLADDCSEPIEHPLLPTLFTVFENGRYERTDVRLRGWTID